IVHSTFGWSLPQAFSAAFCFARPPMRMAAVMMPTSSSRQERFDTLRPFTFIEPTLRLAPGVPAGGSLRVTLGAALGAAEGAALRRSVDDIAAAREHEALDRARFRVDDPILRHADPRVPPELLHAIEAAARRRDDLDGEIGVTVLECNLLTDGGGVVRSEELD